MNVIRHIIKAFHTIIIYKSIRINWSMELWGEKSTKIWSGGWTNSNEIITQMNEWVSSTDTDYGQYYFYTVIFECQGYRKILSFFFLRISSYFTDYLPFYIQITNTRMVNIMMNAQRCLFCLLKLSKNDTRTRY